MAETSESVSQNELFLLNVVFLRSVVYSNIKLRHWYKDFMWKYIPKAVKIILSYPSRNIDQKLVKVEQESDLLFVSL